MIAIKDKERTGIDPECLAMCGVINSLPGLRTAESCCGHGKTKFRIFFEYKAENQRSLAIIAYRLMSCHGGNPDWTLQVITSCGMDGPWFMVEGPIGERAYSEADAIAGRIRSDVEDDKPNVITGPAFKGGRRR